MKLITPRATLIACSLTVAIASLAPAALARIAPGHRLSDSPDRPVRERQIDILRLTADLKFDMKRERIEGTARVRFTPLRAGMSSLELDAFDLAIEGVDLAGNTARLAWKNDRRMLHVTLPHAVAPGEVAEVVIGYSAQPRSGLYFQPGTSERAAQAWNHGESGLHHGWLPLYNDTNDRFSVEFQITVEPPHIALSNGTLKETIENGDGTRTYHWVQEEPIPNYLIALNVGQFSEVPLKPAHTGARSVPLSVWTTPGAEEGVAQVFSNTPRMVEYFAKLLNFPYPWPKYDQVTLHEFGGAMETTSMVGFPDSYERRRGDPSDSSPDFTRPWPIWSTEDTIAHELAHHWFGDLVTCRSLGSLWLNESFATYLHTVWNGHLNGEDDLTYQRWRYLNFYLEDIRASGEVRPLEHLQYHKPEDMYRESTTYIKGSIVIHLLRHIVGDEDFYRTLAHYLKANAFGEVEAADLLAAFEHTTGRDLDWFFHDWIVGGGGHPSIQARARWAPDRRQVDITLTQVQSDQPFENLFRLPIDITISTASGTRSHTVWMEDWNTRVALPADGNPLAVDVDAGNWLVADIHLERTLGELIYLLDNGDLAAGLRAARQIATDYPRRPEGIAALTRVLADRTRHWGLRQEAAINLGETAQEVAAEALVDAAGDPDRRVRRAVAIALGKAGGALSARSLRALIENDTAEDVIAAAAISLGRMHTEDASLFLRLQLKRESRWWNAIRVGALQGLVELEDPELVSTFKEYLTPNYQRHVRLAALEGWFRAAPQDPDLAATLRRMASDRNGIVRADSLGKLGQLHQRDDLDFLREYAAKEANPNLAQGARDAIAEIEAFVSPPRHRGPAGTPGSRSGSNDYR
jgi:aminopeptidase N